MERGLKSGLVSERFLPAWMGGGDPANDGKVPVLSSPSEGDILLLKLPYVIDAIERIYMATYGHSYTASWGSQRATPGDNYAWRLAKRHNLLSYDSAVSFVGYTDPTEGPSIRSSSGTMMTDIEIAATGGATGSASALTVGKATTWVPGLYPGLVLVDGPLNDMLLNVASGLMSTKALNSIWNALTGLYSTLSALAIIQENDASLTYTGTWTNHSANSQMHGGFWSFTSVINSKVTIKVPGSGALTVMLIVFDPKGAAALAEPTSVSFTQNGVGVSGLVIGGTAFSAANALAGITLVNQAVGGAATNSAGNTGRTDPCGTTNTSPTVTDAYIRASDRGKAITNNAGIPASSFVGTVTPGVSYLISSSATSQVNVNATATNAAGICTLTSVTATMVNTFGHVPIVLSGLDTTHTLDITLLAGGNNLGIDCYIVPGTATPAAAATKTITALTNATTTCTATVASTADMYIGQSITVAGCYGFTTNNPNGTWTVATIPSTTTFTFVVGSAPTGTYTASSGTVTGNQIGVPTIIQMLAPHLMANGFTFFYSPGCTNDTIDQINNQVFRAVASSFANVVLVDPNANGWDPYSMLSSDGLHPNDKGYAFLADLIDTTLATLSFRQGQNNVLL